jgi:hypothetical protein
VRRRRFRTQPRPHSAQMVNAKFPEPGPIWFRNGARAGMIAKSGIKGIFTANQISGVFCKFSAL